MNGLGLANSILQVVRSSIPSPCIAIVGLIRLYFRYFIKQKKVGETKFPVDHMKERKLNAEKINLYQVKLQHDMI